LNPKLFIARATAPILFGFLGRTRTIFGSITEFSQPLVVSLVVPGVPVNEAHAKLPRVLTDKDMGFYAKFVFPRVLDWGLGKPDLGGYRERALASATGATLEVGFGTGLNLPHYPPAVDGLTAIDSERMLPDRVQSRIDRARFPVELRYLDAQGRLPFEDASFDTIVTTFTLCSIKEPERALAEMKRVLRPSGSYLFLEHGLGMTPGVQRWQTRMTPFNRIIGCGCHLDRAIDRLILANGWRISKLDRPEMPNAIRLMGELYSGSAGRES
jgi:SAM-dependent methyltransferase